MRRGLVLLLLVAALPLPTGAAIDSTVVRLAGSNRHATAVAIAQDHHHPTGADTVFVTAATSFPDGLVGAAVAGAPNSPVLPTAPDELAGPSPTTHGLVPGFGIDMDGRVYVTDFNDDRVLRIDLAG